jgi:hypothetical protein
MQNCIASLLEGIRAREWAAAHRTRRRWRGEDSRPGEEQGRRRLRSRATIEAGRRPRRGAVGAARLPELHLDASLLDALRAAEEEGKGRAREAARWGGAEEQGRGAVAEEQRNRHTAPRRQPLLAPPKIRSEMKGRGGAN